MTKSCLSQWWMEDFWSIADTYLCMEQYMMAGKAALFSDQEIRKEILACSDPKQIKALGRKVRGFDQKVWDRFKYAIVLNGNWCKFSQNRDLREFLPVSYTHLDVYKRQPVGEPFGLMVEFSGDTPTDVYGLSEAEEIEADME